MDSKDDKKGFKDDVDDLADEMADAKLTPGAKADGKGDDNYSEQLDDDDEAGKK
eukprot:CAMPEP_0113947304 /NCGR_PEP_ID=MMETSP1339-20121228/63846_1 /TAXON_ID=94617 /ORGANISM="Fibrocapsa japonica" /LENGTH=53 /DNA_ID=CAMNT_0000953827 /DNA_START=26 /DNA_END=184 /DNA_ORIENTATION=- /assembly_acc=CAM_ASM_000762